MGDDGREGSHPGGELTRATWPQTARRLLPRLRRLSREIRPTFHLGSVNELTTALMREFRVKVVLWDVDGTLMAHHAPRVDPEVAAGFRNLLAAPGLKHVIVSNCEEERFVQLGRIFPWIPIVLGYDTEEGGAFKIRHGVDEVWRGPGAEAAAAAVAADDGQGSEALRAMRKPSRRLVEAALEEVGMADRPEAALMVGDQYFTDVASANLAGIRSAKVPTLHRASFPAPVRWSQRLEAVLFRLKYGSPRRGSA